MPYIDWNGREQEDAEWDEMKREAYEFTHMTLKEALEYSAEIGSAIPGAICPDDLRGTCSYCCYVDATVARYEYIVDIHAINLNLWVLAESQLGIVNDASSHRWTPVSNFVWSN